MIENYNVAPKALSKYKNERGAVLLTTLLVMTLMATVAVLMLDQMRFAIKRAINVNDYAQADWYAVGAEEYAQAYLNSQLQKGPATQLNAPLIDAQPLVFPIEGGNINFSVKDGSQCLSLGKLANSTGRRHFQHLLDTLGWDPASATRLSAVAADWMDSDTQPIANGAEDYFYLGLTPAYRTANTPPRSVMEMRAWAGMTEAAYQTLRPFVCARDPSAKSSVNVNTLNVTHAPLLASLLGGPDYLATATNLIAERPAGGYVDVEQLRTAISGSGKSLKDASLDSLSFQPDHIWVEIDIRYLEAERTVVLEFEIIDNQAVRRLRRFGDEARRPILEVKKR